jgi:hypothetical protein
MLAALLMASVTCGGPAAIEPCDPIDPVLAASSFVVVLEPIAGQRVSSPLRVHGCSRTFESNVVWELHARDGRVLTSGHTSGGGVSGASEFSFAATFTISESEVGHLLVYERDESNGEGFPTGRSVIPLVLVPGPR